MNRFKDINILEEYTNDGKTYGIYYVTFSGKDKDYKYLLTMNAGTVKKLTHYMGHDELDGICDEAFFEFQQALAKQRLSIK